MIHMIPYSLSFKELRGGPSRQVLQKGQKGMAVTHWWLVLLSKHQSAMAMTEPHSSPAPSREGQGASSERGWGDLAQHVGSIFYIPAV